MEARKVIFKDRIANSYPYVVRSTINNGIRAYVLENKEFLNPANTLSLAQDTFSVFYQEEPYFTGNKVKVLTPKKFKLNKIRGLFIMAICQKSLADFTWGKNSDVAELESFILTLPTDSKGNLAFDFMESYIAELEAERVRELEAYLRATGLSNYTLTKKEELALNIISDTNRGGVTSSNVNSIFWKEFRIGDLFSVKSNPQLNKDSFCFDDNAEYPYFTRTCLNNGIAGYVEFLDDEHKIQGNSIAVGMLGMQFFYMEKDFYAGQFTKTIYPKDFTLNTRLALYFCILFNKFRDI